MRATATSKRALATRRKDSVREADAPFRALTDQWLVGVVISQGGQCKYVNPALARMTGYTEAELLAAPSLLELVADEDRHRVRKNLQRREQAESTTNTCSLRIRRKDGVLAHLSVSGSRISFQGRAAVLSTVLDVTELDRSEHEPSQRELRDASLFANMLEGCVHCRMLFDDDTPQDLRFMRTNPAFERLTGLKDVAGKRATEVIPGIRESNPELFEILGRVARTGEPAEFETCLDSTQNWFRVSVTSSPQPSRRGGTTPNGRGCPRCRGRSCH